MFKSSCQYLENRMLIPVRILIRWQNEELSPLYLPDPSPRPSPATGRGGKRTAKDTGSPIRSGMTGEASVGRTRKTVDKSSEGV